MKKSNVLILIVITLAGMAFFWSNGQSKKCKTSAKSVAENNIDREAVLLDVRTPAEYESGHLEEAINIDVKSQDFFEKIGQLDKSKKYYVYCRSGKRSSKAQQIMMSRNFKDVCNVDGGILEMEKVGAEIVK